MPKTIVINLLDKKKKKTLMRMETKCRIIALTLWERFQYKPVSESRNLLATGKVR